MNTDQSMKNVNDMNNMNMEDKQLADLLGRYNTILRSAFRSMIKTKELPVAMLQVLSILQERGQMKMGDIASEAGLSRPNLTPLIDKLESMHYIERSPSSHDRRVIYIRLTDDGRGALENEKDGIAQEAVKFLGRLEETDRDRFLNSLETVSEYFLK